MTTLTRAGAGNWARVRRWATPPSMILAATRARLAGDWRAACAAANVDVDAAAVDRGDFAPFSDDLAHFAPDLLRWHLPRKPGRGDTHLDARQVVQLAGTADGPSLYVGGTRVGFGSQRLRLFVTAEPLDPDAWDDWEWDDGPRPFHAMHDYRDRRHLWDARASGALLAGCGWTHLPFFDPAGNPLPERAWGRAERILALHDAGRHREAWQAAGADVPAPPQPPNNWTERILRQHWQGFLGEHAAVVDAARKKAGAAGGAQVGLPFGWSHVVRLTGFDGGRLTGEWVPTGYRDRDADWHLDPAPYQRPIDGELLRAGALPVTALHPLVHAAFFPEAPPLLPRATPPPAPEARLRCRGGAWHHVRMTGGRFEIPHDDDERRREEALVALGGQVYGCLAAERRWREPGSTLPRALHELRRDLMLRAQHGDLAGVLELLDAGVDPHARDPHGRTLLHHLGGLLAGPGDLPLLDRLLAAGLDVDARDRRGMTPLQALVNETGPAFVARALLDAGADPDTVDDQGVSLADTLDRYGGTELAFLRPPDA
ncbi:ankyrin repeat domain-containing protein [Dactylosporangium aurantiacum]|uniref:Ankyrin repeat domain-containing protein n=1 Tax=Dactylosporangium aurantiacum TaxID=35754 RepID=A0A9Q9MEB0_9ACTN|nr:ankyrin repeat domain-containing protein [Dactylosporangium aurantiacum]MDG6102688.1 ankyrin repeat domain-containing protein [Dactylosporangium aurantiacum]UWZ53064.1 ankyrin repeat domain-containing protein [Dactylosporangium aurantiacum]